MARHASLEAPSGSATVAELLSPTARKRVYLTFAIVSAIVAGGLGGFAAVGILAPVWLIFTSSFLATFGTAVGLFAAGNITPN